MDNNNIPPRPHIKNSYPKEKEKWCFSFARRFCAGNVQCSYVDEKE